MFRRQLFARLPVAATVMLAAIAALGGALLTAAQGGPQASELEVSVEALAPWTIGETLSNDDAYVVKVDSEYANVLIGRFPPDASTESADAAMVGPYAALFEKVEVVESGTSAGMLYTLNLVTIDGKLYGAFSLYAAQGSSGSAEGYAFLAPVSRFAEELTSAKTNITVEGDSIFGGVAGDGLQSRLEAAAGATASDGDTAPLGTSTSATPAASPEASPAT